MFWSFLILIICFIVFNIILYTTNDCWDLEDLIEIYSDFFNKENKKKMKKGFIGGISLAFIIMIAIIILNLCTVRVPAGYVAVQYNMNGGVKDTILTQGWHLVSPTIHTTLYTVGIEQSYLTKGDEGDSKKNESFSASSSEGKDIEVDLTFTYQFNPEKVTQVFTQFKGQSGKEVRDSFVKPNIVSWSKEVIARYKVADILGAQRANINIALTEYLAERFAPYGITISNVSLINLEVDADTSAAINAKIKAQQDAETQAINNQTAIDKAAADASVKKTQTQAEADAKLIKAQADADALRIEAEAEAAANEMITKSLTDSVLQEMWIERWDGVLPTYMTSGETANSLMIGIE